MGSSNHVNGRARSRLNAVQLETKKNSIQPVVVVNHVMQIILHFAPGLTCWIVLGKELAGDGCIRTASIVPNNCFGP